MRVKEPEPLGRNQRVVGAGLVVLVGAAGDRGRRGDGDRRVRWCRSWRRRWSAELALWLPTLSETLDAVAVAVAAGDGGVGAADEGDRSPRSRNVSQLPPVSVAVSRSTTWLEASRPEPASRAPVERERDGAGWCTRGRRRASTVWPVGAVVSLVTVKVSVAVRPAPLVAVTVWAPEALVGVVPGVASPGRGWWCRRRRRSSR